MTDDHTIGDMAKYVALLRGVTPTNPDMRNERLRGVCEALGLGDVDTVLSSGNVLFEADVDDVEELEATLEAAWSERLGFESTTIIRSRRELQDLMELQPFGELTHGPESYLLVTFSKGPLTVDVELPHQPADRDYTIVGSTDREVFSVTDTTSARTPDVMGWMEQHFGKQISSRTWLTVTRILDKLSR